jgi:hypothetical protein
LRHAADTILYIENLVDQHVFPSGRKQPFAEPSVSPERPPTLCVLCDLLFKKWFPSGSGHGAAIPVGVEFHGGEACLVQA